MSQRDDLMAGVSGVRGIVGSGMNPETAVRFTAAFASHLAGGLVAVGRDTRASGPLLSSAVFSALGFKGITAVDLGIASTPTVEIMVGELRADGGIVITASHNGPEWNALKFLDSHGEFLSARDMEEVSRRSLGGEPLFDKPGGMGSVVANGTGDAVHIRKILELARIDRDRIAERRFKVVVDCVNGAGSRVMPALLRSLGVVVVELYTDVEAPFPHDPEPRPQNLVELSRAVVREKADLGFACDPDGDRLVLVDDTGTVLSEELTLAVAADFVLKEEPGPLVANLSTSRLIDDIGARQGVPVHRSKVGEAHVIQLMKEEHATIGGEGNGGVIYPRLHYGRDAMAGVALTLQSLAEEHISLSKKVSAFPGYVIVKQKFPLRGDFRLVEKSLEKRFSGRLTTVDGIRIDMANGWIHLRRSNTEPVVRVIAEARSLEEANDLAREAGKLL
ncbi:MAG TPA: phosphoglucosamine mutase [Candidatus Bathyarchaeia archaeon]|nr:phosphoglucosamine mutase [Candidatus Bathyarchaeia archaeon]